jgi:hypothetical protein
MLVLQELDRESPAETALRDAIDAASTWRQVRDAVRAAPPGALTVHAAGDAVSTTSRLLRQQHLPPGALPHGQYVVTEGPTGAAEDDDDRSAGGRTPEEQQWLQELAAMWSDERAGELRGKRAAEVLTSLLLARLDAQDDVVERLMRRFAEDSAGLGAEVFVRLLWAAYRAGVVLPEEAVAGMLLHVEADFQQLTVWQLLCLTRCLQTLPTQQSPDALHDALVARCLRIRLDARNDDTRSMRLALVEAVRQLSPEASEKLVCVVERMAMSPAAPTKLAQQAAQAVQSIKVGGEGCAVTLVCASDGWHGWLSAPRCVLCYQAAAAGACTWGLICLFLLQPQLRSP